MVNAAISILLLSTGVNGYSGSRRSSISMAAAGSKKKVRNQHMRNSKSGPYHPYLNLAFALHQSGLHCMILGVTCFARISISNQ